MSNIPKHWNCIECGSEAKFWSTRLEENFCSDGCYEKIVRFICKYNKLSNSEIRDERIYFDQPVSIDVSKIQGDFKINGSVVTLVQQAVTSSKSKDSVSTYSGGKDKIDFETVMAQEKRRKEFIASLFPVKDKTKDKTE